MVDSHLQAAPPTSRLCTPGGFKGSLEDFSFSFIFFPSLAPESVCSSWSCWSGEGNKQAEKSPALLEMTPACFLKALGDNSPL